MSEIERDEFAKAAKALKSKVTKSKKEAQQFLIELGVFTEKGEVLPPYENLCIPQDPA
jgi:hypothetical protein